MDRNMDKIMDKNMNNKSVADKKGGGMWTYKNEQWIFKDVLFGSRTLKQRPRDVTIKIRYMPYSIDVPVTLGVAYSIQVL